MPPLISVIIPAYNLASRVKSSLQSVVAQDYENTEIIFIDDASQDDTPKIADEVLSSSGKIFQIITLSRNKGVSAARNTGLENSHGEYICFFDGDDLLQKNFLSRLYELITKYNADFSCCSFARKFINGKKDIFSPLNIGRSCPCNGEEIIFRHISPACCLYGKAFLKINALKFFEGCSSGEDVEFQIKALCFAERVAFTKECLYFYVQHENMGSIRDNNTREKKITRYEHNTSAQIRTALFLEEHAKTQRVKFFNENILQPQNIIRLCNIAIMNNDRTGYNKIIREREILSKAEKFSVLLKKPEIFFKALMILHFPKIYYRMRDKQDR